MMLVYRVFPRLPQADLGDVGHPLHIGRQGLGRLDNPAHYRVWYLAFESSGAIAEAFGHRRDWNHEMFECPIAQGSRLALATYLLDDDTPLLDLDDAGNLYSRGLRPTQVIERNRAATQAWALRVHDELNDRGHRIWQGVKWWSYYHCQWRIAGYWGERAPLLLDVDELTLDSPAVTDAAVSLRRGPARGQLCHWPAVRRPVRRSGHCWR
jgi:hypothetical protein